MSQVVGVVLASVGAWLLWSPWSLVIGGLVLLIAPEIGVLASRRKAV